MLRIGVDARILNARQRTGIGVYTHNLVRSLASLYSDDRFFLLYPALVKREMKGWGYDKLSNISVRAAMVPDSIREDRFYRLWLDFYLPLTIRMMGLDVFHGPANLVPSGGKVKRVLTVHDLSFIVTPEVGFDCSPIFLERFRKGAGDADAIIAVSECTKGDIVRHCGVRPEKVEVIYEGVDRRFRVMDSDTVREEWRSRLGLPPDFILGPLSLHPRKNCLNLIRAYAIAREGGCRHILVLPGKDYGRSECRRLAEDLNLKDHVLFTGYVDDDGLLSLYNLASVFMYPSLYEGFGLPILEAMACGCPVIASERGSIPEVAGDAALYIDPEDIEGIARAMALVLNDELIPQSLKGKGLERVRFFSWEQCARKTHDLYVGLAINKK